MPYTSHAQSYRDRRPTQMAYTADSRLTRSPSPAVARTDGRARDAAIQTSLSPVLQIQRRRIRNCVSKSTTRSPAIECDGKAHLPLYGDDRVFERNAEPSR